MSRFNLVDLLCVVFVLALLPVAYSSWLLFQPAAPRIDRVERSEVTSAEEKIAAGLPIRLKVKIRGANLTPMLRAVVGGVPAIGFTFETPASGDVIIGDNVPPGTHDLVLYDGTIEVARARGAVTIAELPNVFVRAIGAVTLLDRNQANELAVGQRFTIDGQLLSEIVALADMTADQRAVRDGTGTIDVKSPATWARDAIVRVRCDPGASPRACHVDGRAISDGGRPVISLPGTAGALRMRVEGIAPDQTPSIAIVRVQVAPNPALYEKIRVGDRDVRWPSIDDRAATVIQIARRGDDAIVMSVRLGADRAADGWRYHGQRLAAGELFTFVNDRYSTSGTVLDMVVNGN